MPTSRRPNRSFRKTPANRSWTGSVLAAPVVVAAATKVLLTTFSLSNQNIDETVLRVVGGINVMSDQQAATEDQIGAVGFILVTNQAAAAGVASMPGPVTDNGDDGWFVYQAFSQRFGFVTAAGVEAQFSTWYEINSKAKRVIHEGRAIAVIAENAHATQGFSIGLAFRMLSMVRGT